MSSYKDYNRRLKHDEKFIPDNLILQQESFTGFYHPLNHKPIYSFVALDLMSTYDGSDTWINTSIFGMPTGIDLCWVDDFIIYNWNVGENTYTSCNKAYTWVDSDTSEARIWVKGNGTQYQKRFPNNTNWKQTLYIFFEYTKAADAAAY